MEPTYKKIDNFYFDPKSPLGSGVFASVYKAFNEKNNNAVVAVKVISATKLGESEEQYNLFMREIDVLRQIQGNHIVQLLDVKRTPNNLYIFTDYCDGGDLQKPIKNRQLFSENDACLILKQIADAFVTLAHLDLVNSNNQKVTLMHRDIKPANILFHQGRVKVADFGFAKLIDDVDKDIRKPHTLLGTPLYMAPQILNDESYSSKCDIWSSGLLFYECMYGKLPWTGNSMPNLYDNIMNKPLEFPGEIRRETKDLLSKMLQIKDEERITWKEVYEHPALQYIDISNKISGMGTSPSINNTQYQNNYNSKQEQQQKYYNFYGNK